MEILAAVLLLLGGSVWVGAIVFQSAVVAPAVFANLDEAAARLFLRGLFPKFFRFGLICGLLMAIAIALLAMARAWSVPLLSLAVIIGAMLVLQYVSLRMVPAINAARDAGTPGQASFHRLHRASVLLTIVVLMLGMSVLALFGRLAAAGLGA